MTDKFHFKITVTSHPDKNGEQDFTLEWRDENCFYAELGYPDRAQCFHAVLQDHIDRIVEAGHTYEMLKAERPKPKKRVIPRSRIPRIRRTK